MDNQVAVYLIPISTPYEEIIPFKEEVVGMDIVIQEYINTRLPKDIEVFKVEGNLIVSEDGYRLAYFI